ncbi:hypothetical protein AMBAS45_17270 [Alteromonas macleodii str. 'Balearic Sea AD45']|nr:hypothetical protein AMBAS45_17270 [Alteromonas macleodii str. 'Balearic Sea AD45']
MTHLLPSKSSTLKQKRLIKKYRDRSLRLLEKINPSEKRGVYHQSEPAYAGFFCFSFVRGLLTFIRTSMPFTSIFKSLNVKFP